MLPASVTAERRAIWSLVFHGKGEQAEKDRVLVPVLVRMPGRVLVKSEMKAASRRRRELQRIEKKARGIWRCAMDGWGGQAAAPAYF